jgi:hypothetical protein
MGTHEVKTLDRGFEVLKRLKFISVKSLMK